MSRQNKHGSTDEHQATMKASIGGHLRIARFDHWVKNVFVLPGIVVAISMQPDNLDIVSLAIRSIIGLIATGLIASSNYVINEILDAPFDRKHPIKKNRPVPSGQVNIPIGYVQWLGLMVLGVAVGSFISMPFVVALLSLWVMGIIYNVRPFRSKDKPYVDVLSEAVNNPIRFLLGWFIVGTMTVPPVSLLLSYWMVGCYFMAIKRYAEYREIDDSSVAESYRQSFGFYNERRLIVAIMFYASVAMLFFGAFIVRYRLELVLSFPMVAAVMATYLSIAFKDQSAAQAPEKLYREPNLMVSVIVCTILIGVLLFVDIPFLYRLFPASVQTLSDLTSFPL